MKMVLVGDLLVLRFFLVSICQTDNSEIGRNELHAKLWTVPLLC